MAFAIDILKMMEEQGDKTWSSTSISEFFGYDPEDESKRYYSKPVISINLNDMKNKKMIICVGKKGATKLYKHPKFVKEGEEFDDLPKLDSGEPIPEKYKRIFRVKPIDENVCETIQNIKYKILTDGILTLEQEAYVEGILKNILIEESE